MRPSLRCAGCSWSSSSSRRLTSRSLADTVGSATSCIRRRGPPPAGRVCRVPAGDRVAVGLRSVAVRLVAGRLSSVRGSGGGGTIVVAALVARDLEGGRSAQTLAAVTVGFAPILIATNGLFQPVSFDQLATIVVLWLALRLALGRGSWMLLGLAAGVGLETKYTLAVVLVLLLLTFLVWRRDADPQAWACRWRWDRRRAPHPQPRMGGPARLDERALVPRSAAERDRRVPARLRRRPCSCRRIWSPFRSPPQGSCRSPEIDACGRWAGRSSRR